VAVRVGGLGERCPEGWTREQARWAFASSEVRPLTLWPL
jgi:hypothetical protein